MMIAGCGYLGQRIAANWHQNGLPVFALARSTQRATEFQAKGWQAVVGDVATGLTTELPAVQTLVFAVGFDREADYDRRTLHPGGLGALLHRLPNLRRVVYISTTGVYGDSQGEWIDETAPTSPDRDSSQACVLAEQVVNEWVASENRSGSSLRLGGIYGPDRVPYARQLLANQELNASPLGYLNLIQVEDAARITCLIAAADNCPAILNVTDGVPVVRDDYFKEIARLVGAPAPRYSNSHGNGNRGSANRRISNACLRNHLAFELQFPCYRDGLADAIASLQAGN